MKTEEEVKEVCGGRGRVEEENPDRTEKVVKEMKEKVG